MQGPPDDAVPANALPPDPLALAEEAQVLARRPPAVGRRLPLVCGLVLEGDLSGRDVVYERVCVSFLMVTAAG